MKKITTILLSILTIFNINAAQHYIEASNFSYTPSSLTINQGDTVTWINTGGTHDVNGDINAQTGSSFNNPVSFYLSAVNSPDTIGSYVFTVTGSYDYDCSIGSHAAMGMVASINVVSPPNTVYDIISNSPDHTTLETAIDACSLDGTLSGSGPFTVFAPTDNAFGNLPAGTLTALLNDIPALTDILLHHVVGDSVMSGMLSNNQIVTTLLGTDVTVTIDSNGNVFIDNALVTLADVVGDNGVVHIIDAVLLPNFDCNGVIDGPALVDTCGDCQLAYIYDYVTHNVTFLNDTNNVVLGATEVLVLPDNPMNPYWNSGCVPNTVYDIISNSVDHTTLKAAIDACSLDGTLSGPGPFTVFAPTDNAFGNLPAGTVTALLNDIPALTDILLHHVVGDSVMSGMLSNNQIVTTLLGTDVTVTINSNGDVYIDNAMVTVVDLVGDNGVIHVIDAVLLPNISSQVDIPNSSNIKYLHTLNILGVEVDDNLKNQLLFRVYSDGSIEKIVNK